MSGVCMILSLLTDELPDWVEGSQQLRAPITDEYRSAKSQNF
jgi:hypothetical protein